MTKMPRSEAGFKARALAPAPRLLLTYLRNYAMM